MNLRPTRREVMRDGIAASGVIALGVLGPVAEAAAAPAQVEARALTQAVQIEQLVVIAYRQVVASELIKPAVKGQLRTLLDHELAHVALLQRALEDRGEMVPAAPGLPEAQAALARRQVHWSLTNLQNQHDALKLLVDLESLAENAYFQAIQKLQDLKLAGTCVEIMGCEAQHWTILGGLLNHQDPTRAVPYPFVEGTP